MSSNLTPTARVSGAGLKLTRTESYQCAFVQRFYTQDAEMDDYVEQRIREREAQLDRITSQINELQTSRRELEAELRAYKDVLNYRSADRASPSVIRVGGPRNAKLIRPQRISYRLSNAWREIFRFIGSKNPNPVNIDEVRSFARSSGLEISDDTLRSQFSVYNARGWLARVSTGNYILTGDGAAGANVNLRMKQPSLGDYSTSSDELMGEEEEREEEEEEEEPENNYLWEDEQPEEESA